MNTQPHKPGESRLHQLSPYVGKLKSSTARTLVSRFTSSSDLVVDPFAGSGTIALEAKILGRSTFSSDISEYSRVITLGKLHAPTDLRTAEIRLSILIEIADAQPDPDLRKVPAWVRKFFHPKTLKEAIKFADTCIKTKDYFYLSCLLGILHHQRPGFLSYPSSHLTPYLRDKKFPRIEFPDMYEYRDIRSRLQKKIARALFENKTEALNSGNKTTQHFRKSSISGLTWPAKFGALLTSPPYMNALDYGRDNRLRLWFLTRRDASDIDAKNVSTRAKFESAIDILAREAERGLKRFGYIVIIIGEYVDRGRQAHTSQIAKDTISRYRKLRFVCEEKNPIPAIRRSRRNCFAVKDEVFLVFQKK